MKYYAAVCAESEINATRVFPPFRILCSYHYFKNKPEVLFNLQAEGAEIFIDSGAFSAENTGTKIDIDEYIAFLKTVGSNTYAGLDVIGNAKETMENQRYMEAAGLKPIPTFHLGSPLESLDEIINYPYIALGGLVFGSGLEQYLDKVWSHILTNMPTLRVHGFGLTNIELMNRYPWYSVDSSSYKGCKRFGRQQILYNGFNFKTFSEEDYISLLERKFIKVSELTNTERYFLYDLFSVESYKNYAAHLTELNKHRKFPHLTAQKQLF